MISLKNIDKTFKNNNQHKVLSDFNYNFLPDTLYVVKGSNGSGKTTLLKLIAGLILPNKGEIVFQCQKKIGFVSSNERSFFGRLTAYENLEFFCSLDDIDPKNIKKYINNSHSELNISSFANKKFHLSSGQKKKLAIIRALLKAPNIILMDEPFNFLDDNTKAELIKLIKQILANKNIYILLSSHDEISDYFENHIALELNQLSGNEKLT